MILTHAVKMISRAIGLFPAIVRTRSDIAQTSILGFLITAVGQVVHALSRSLLDRRVVVLSPLVVWFFMCLLRAIHHASDL